MTLRAPNKFKKYVNSLIGIKYAEGELYEAKFSEEGANCWGCNWHLYNYLGIDMPSNARAAHKILVPAWKPEFGVTVIFLSHEIGRRPHCGFMEDERTVIQCALATRGVARLPIDWFLVKREFLQLPEDLKTKLYAYCN
jgi:hypothetical protein